MKKKLTWLRLYNKIGKQLLSRTRGNYVTIIIDGKEEPLKLVFTDSGSKFHFEIDK